MDTAVWQDLWHSGQTARKWPTRTSCYRPPADPVLPIGSPPQRAEWPERNLNSYPSKETSRPAPLSPAQHRRIRLQTEFQAVSPRSTTSESKWSERAVQKHRNHTWASPARLFTQYTRRIMYPSSRSSMWKQTYRHLPRSLLLIKLEDDKWAFSGYIYRSDADSTDFSETWIVYVRTQLPEEWELEAQTTGGDGKIRAGAGGHFDWIR